MPLFAEYNVDQLSRLLTYSKWALGVCALLVIGLAIFNQWLAGRILHLQEEQRISAERRMRSSQTEAARAKARADDAAAALLRFTAPRSLTDEQIASLRQCLPDGPRGKVVMASLKTESDAESYAAQIGKLLGECGFQVTTAKTVWLQLAVKGIYLCARDPSYAPTHAVHIQRCFQSAGLRLRAHEDTKMFSDMAVPDDAVIFVVSSRE